MIRLIPCEHLFADTVEDADEALQQWTQESELQRDSVISFPTQPPVESQMKENTLSQRDRW